MINLKDEYIEFIKKIINDLLPDVEIFIFGSRVQGVAKEYSDVDIALRSLREISFGDVLKLKSLFENSTFPYKVDIIDLDSIKPEFYNLIKDDLQKIN